MQRPNIGAGTDIKAFRWPSLRTVAELAGMTCIVAAAWLTALPLGLLTLGIALILAANYAGRGGIPPTSE